MTTPATGVRRISRSHLVVLLVSLAGVVAMLVPTTARAASYSPSGYAARLLSLVNQAREQHGLRPLVETAGTDTVAAAWTSHLADSQTLSHNPDLQQQLESHGSRSWTTYGENVGTGGALDPDGLFRAYMASPEHRDNILTAAYRYVGVGVVFTGRTSWNTFDFVDAYGATTRPVVRRHVVRHAVARPAVARQARPTRVVHQDPVPAASARPTHTAVPPRVHHHPRAVRRHQPRTVAVESLQARWPARHPIAEAVIDAAAPTAATSLTTPAPAPAPRTVLIGLAVLVLAAIGRRWVLAVSR